MTRTPRILLDKDEVARRLSLRNKHGEIDGSLVYDRRRLDPKFPQGVRFGRELRWHEDEIDAFIASLTAEPSKKGGEQ